MAEGKKREYRFTGKHMWLAMIGFFGVIISVNLTLAYLASGSWTGLVVKNSYVASQKFNEQLESAKKQRALGLSSEFSYQGGSISFVLKNKNGQVITAKNLVAEIGRPAFEQLDQKLSFLPARDNRYALPVNLEPGIWRLRITGNVDEFIYRRDVRLFVNAEGQGTLE
ncbi:MAG: FixH family protein [Rhizobiaceae bacterium]